METYVIFCFITVFYYLVPHCLSVRRSHTLYLHVWRQVLWLVSFKCSTGGMMWYLLGMLTLVDLRGRFPQPLTFISRTTSWMELTEIGGKPCKVIGRTICWPYRADGLLVAASLNGTRLPVTGRSDSRPSLPGGQRHCVTFFLMYKCLQSC